MNVLEKLRKQVAELYAKWRDLVHLCGSGELSNDEIEALVPLADSYSRAARTKTALLNEVELHEGHALYIRALAEAPGGWDIAPPLRATIGTSR